MGRSKRAAAEPTLPEALVAVSARAGAPVWIPPNAPGHCCGVPFSSKGHRGAHSRMAARTTEALWRWTDGGALPVVSDASSCTLGLGAEAVDALPGELKERHAKLEILDAVEWLERLMPKLPAPRRLDRVAVHPTCATRHLGLTRRLEALAGAIAAEAVVPVTATCCGFAGDRGMLRPELTAAATAPEARELAERGPFDAYLSTNRTCELGLERATGAPYGSIVLAVEELTR
jgi:D-lactate dehydrogenase